MYMSINYKMRFLFIFIYFTYFIFSADNKNKIKSVIQPNLYKQYDHTLTNLSSLENNIPNKEVSYKLKLRYQNQQNDFFIFYDDKGEVIFLKFRIDQWDYMRKKLSLTIQPGLLYEIDFKYWGIVNEQPIKIQKKILPYKMFDTSIANALPKLQNQKIDKTKVGEFLNLRYVILDTIQY